MKRKLYMLFMLFNIFVVTGCTEADEFGPNIPNPDSIPDDTDKIVVESALNKVAINNEVTSDFKLPLLIDNVAISYESSSNSILINGENATVNRTEYDQSCIITASGYYNGKTYSKIFNVTILKYDFENIIPEVLAELDIPKVVSEDFVLETNVSGVEISYKSNNDAIAIDGKNAIVTQQENDVTISITAYAKYEVFSGSKTFDIKVEKKSNPIDGIFDDMNLALEVEEDFSVKTSIDGYGIQWQSNNEEVITIVDGVALVNQEYYDTTVLITASTSFMSFNEERTYTIKVVGDEENPLEGSLDNLILPTTVESDFSLPSEINGYDVTYTSNNSAIQITNYEASVTQSNSSSVRVSIVATITDGDFELSKVYEVLVLKKENPIENILENLTLPASVRESFALETNLLGYDVTYTSNNSQLVINGDIANVTRTTQDVNVTVTAKVEFDGFVETKSFNITIVKPVNNIPAILNDLVIETTVTESFDLVTEIDGVTLTYTSNSDSIQIVGNQAIVSTGLVDDTATIIVIAKDEYYDGSKSFNIFIPGLYGDPATLSAYQTYTAVADVLEQEQYYTKTSKGTSKASIVTQDILNVTTKNNDYTMLVASSESSMVKVNHKAMFNNSNVAYSHNSTTINSANLTSYQSDFGVDAASYQFTGYDITEDSILSSSSYVGFDNGLHSYKLVINHDDVNTTADLRQQIYKFGGLVKLPEMKTIEITLMFDKNFRLHVIQSYEFYVVTKKVFVDTNYNTTQILTTSIQYYTEDNLPENFFDYSDYKNKLN